MSQSRRLDDERRPISTTERIFPRRRKGEGDLRLPKGWLARAGPGTYNCHLWGWVVMSPRE